MHVYRGGEALRSGVSIAVLIAVTLVMLAAAVVLGWWLLTVFVHPLPYSQPEAMDAVGLR